MQLRLFVLALLAGFSAAAAADSLDINVGSDSVEAGYTTYFRTAELGFGFLYNDDHNDWAASAGLIALGIRESPKSRSYAGLGGKLYLASVRDDEVLALGLGGLFRWFPGNGPVGLGVQLFYAPDVLTGLDGKRFWDASGRVEFEVVKDTASLYLGYRRVRAHMESGARINLDKGAHVGIRIAF